MLELMSINQKRRPNQKEIVSIVGIILLVIIGAYVLETRSNQPLPSNTSPTPTRHYQSQLTTISPSQFPTDRIQVSVSPGWKLFHSSRGHYSVQIPLTPWTIDYRYGSRDTAPEEQATTIQLHDNSYTNSVIISPDIIGSPTTLEKLKSETLVWKQPDNTVTSSYSQFEGDPALTVILRWNDQSDFSNGLHITGETYKYIYVDRGKGNIFYITSSWENKKPESGTLFDRIINTVTFDN